MEVPAWKVLANTNACASRTGVAPTAITKPRQVSSHVWLTLLCFRALMLYMLTLMFMFPPTCSSAWVECHERSGIQPQTSLRPGGPSPTLQLRCRLSHEWHFWQQYLSGWAVIVSYLLELSREILFLLLLLLKEGQLQSSSLELAPCSVKSHKDMEQMWQGTLQLKGSLPESFTALVINMVTNESNLWSQSVTNKIILTSWLAFIQVTVLLLLRCRWLSNTLKGDFSTCS